MRKARADLKRENAELREELFRQWEFNHAEHCQNKWPHEGRCSWPLPAALVNSVTMLRAWWRRCCKAAMRMVAETERGNRTGSLADRAREAIRQIDEEDTNRVGDE